MFFWGAHKCAPGWEGVNKGQNSHSNSKKRLPTFGRAFLRRGRVEERGGGRGGGGLGRNWSPSLRDIDLLGRFLGW